MLDRLRFGISGSGYMAKLHSLALRNIGALLWPELPTIEMVRMADVVPEAARIGAERWGWKEHTADWRRVTQADDIDVVIIITPNDSHALYALDAFKHDKHVFCEKPLSNSLEAAESMARAARSSSRISLVNYSYRCWPGVELARELLRSGELGEPLHFQGHFFQDYAADPDQPFSWRFDKTIAGGGAFADIGSHIMDIACALMGPVRRVAAKSRRFLPTRPTVEGGQREVTVDDMTVSLLEFASGAVGSVHASWAATGFKCDLGFSIVGSKGSAHFSWERNNELHFYSGADAKRLAGFRRIMLGGIHPGADPFWYAQGQGLGYGEAFVITARRLIEAIVTNTKTVVPSFDEALHVAYAIDGASRAASTDAWVTLPTTSAYL
jgi:predicted dehydrogenase